MKKHKNILDVTDDTYTVQEYLDYLNDYIIDYYTNKSDIYRPPVLEATLLKDMVVGTDVTGMVFDFSNVTYESMTAYTMYGCTFVLYRPTQISVGQAPGFKAPMICAFARAGGDSRPSYANNTCTFYIGGSYGEYKQLEQYSQPAIGDGAIPVFTINKVAQTLTWHEPFDTQKTYTIGVLPYLPELTTYEMSGGVNAGIAYPITLNTTVDSGIEADCEYLYGIDETITEAINELEAYAEELGTDIETIHEEVSLMHQLIDNKSDIYWLGETLPASELQIGYDMLNATVDFSALTPEMLDVASNWGLLRTNPPEDLYNVGIIFSLITSDVNPDTKRMYCNGSFAIEPDAPVTDADLIFTYTPATQEIVWEPAYAETKKYTFSQFNNLPERHYLSYIGDFVGFNLPFDKIMVTSGNDRLGVDCEFLHGQLGAVTEELSSTSDMVWGLKADQPWYKINSLDEVKVLDAQAQHMLGKIGYLPQYDAYFVYLQLINVNGLDWYYGAYNAVPKLISEKFSEPMEAVSLGPVPDLDGQNTLGITPMDYQRWQDSQGALFVSMALTPASSGFMWINFCPQVTRIVMAPDPNLLAINMRLSALEAKLPDAPDGMTEPMVLTAEEDSNNE
jgi:hypothetical protein